MQRAYSPPAWRYSTPAIVLHWLLAALIVFMASLGWWMMTVEDTPGGERFFVLHKSVGLILLALVALRVLWRLAHRPESLPAAVPRWQVLLSGATQAGLYLLMIAVPLTGLLGAMYSRAGLVFFGTDLPRWVAASRPTAKQFFELHETLVWVLVVLVVLHVAGGLKHLLVDRDQVFARMWPARR
ncbi:cytochrome b [Ramlibacter sp. AN1133]|uniref:cytochrome b n=1 Tax=Ramlibacter sp. AN1133 TaxID=3133429 RepID=UPI0030C3BD86